jgi:pantoate--beta-alanine ligase
MTFSVHKSVESIRLFSRNAAVRPTLIPTMGALHDGHRELIRHATTYGRPVVVSIFVNPLQFGPQEDFNRYPGNLEEDLYLAREAGADCVWTPTPDVLTPTDLTFSIDPGPLGDVLCGMFRPGHFRGVSTIVLKLFSAVEPGAAVFGWKDAQQFILISRMVRDLNLPIEMIGVETVRESDGLAMSSRNRYLSPDHRSQASQLGRTLMDTQDWAYRVQPKSAEIIDRVQQQLCSIPGVVEIQYVSCVSKTSLQPLAQPIPGDTLLAAAIRFPEVRLIDNVRW